MKYFISILLVVFCGVISAQEVTPGPYIPPPAETGNTIFSTVNPPPQGAQYSWNGFIPNNTNGGGLQGGNIPAYNTQTGTFIFGYMPGTVNYTTAVNYALRNAGTGIQVSGFKYQWEYFNQDFSRGTLSANISLTAPNKSILESYNYNLPKTTNGWTMMSGIENFNNPYLPQNLGDLRVSFSGKDDRFWAGYYGPQIRQFDVRLLYTPTPPPPPEFLRWVKIADEWGTFTVNEPTTVRYGGEGTYLYATFQPGTYACNNFEWGKDPIGGVYKSCSLGTNTPLSPPKLSTTTTADLTTTTTNTIIAAAAEPVNTTSTTTTVAPSTNNTIAEPVTTVTVSPTGVSATTTTTASASSTSPAGAITVVREEAAVTKEASAERTASGPSLSSVLANIRSNQDRQNAIAMNAVASSIEVANNVTQKAEQLAIEAASTSAQQALQTAANSSAMTGGNRSVNNGMSIMDNNRQSQATNNSQINVLPGVNNNSAVFDLFARPESKNITPSAVAMIDYSLRPQTNIATSTYVAPSLSLIRPESRPIETIVDNQFNIQEIKPILRQPVIEIFSNNNTASISNSTIIFGKRGDPIQDYIEANNAMFSEMKNESRPTTARINVQDNELAGGVKIERMAIVPNGFSVYTSFMLTNIAFYEPKEIYKNNVPKDNVRSMYFLEKGNTDTFNKMIEGQYR